MKPDLHNFVQEFFDKVDILLNNSVHNGYNALMSYLAAPLAVLMLLAIVMFGWRMWVGFGEDVKFSDLLKLVITWSLVYMFAMDWGNFSKFVVDFLDKGIIDGVSSALLNQGGGITTLNTAIQSSLNTINNVAANVLDAAGIDHMSYFLYGVLVYILGLVMMALMIVEVLVAKVMMAILFTIAPLVIPTTLFKRTESIFNNWVGNLVGFSLLFVMITILLMFATVLVSWVLPTSSAIVSADYFTGLGDQITMFIVVSIVIAVLIFKVSVTAMHIGGGVSGANGASVVGGALAGAGLSMSAMRKTKDTIKGNYKNARKIGTILRKMRSGD